MAWNFAGLTSTNAVEQKRLRCEQREHLFPNFERVKKVGEKYFLCVCLSYSASKYCKNYHTVMLKMMNAVEATTPKNCSSSRAIEWIDQFTM